MYSRPQFIDLTYMGGTGPCGLMTIIFGSVLKSQYTSLNIQFGVNRTFHVLKTLVYRFDIYGRYRSCGLMRLIIGSVIKSWYTSLNMKFGVNRTFHVLKTLVYRFDLYGRQRALQTDENNCWQCYLELVYKPKYPIWCESDVPCAQDSSIPI